MKYEKHGSAVALSTNAQVPVYPHKLFLHFPWHQGFDDHNALNVPSSFNQNFSKMSETSQCVLCVGVGPFLWVGIWILFTDSFRRRPSELIITCQRTKTREEKNLQWGLTLAETQRTWSSLDFTDSGLRHTTGFTGCSDRVILTICWITLGSSPVRVRPFPIFQSWYWIQAFYFKSSSKHSSL